MKDNRIGGSQGHSAAFFTVFVWGTTFISTKVLLQDFEPVEILVVRFLLGYLLLLAFFPRRLKTTGKKQEAVFLAAGLCGICLYYLLENIALTYTLASNVGVIISAAPFFTALLSRIFLKSEERLGICFFLGFFMAMGGILLISFGGASLQVNPKGDFLALLAAFTWACYSVLTRKISSYGYPVILATRRTFFYGLVFMIPAVCVFGIQLHSTQFTNPVNLLNLLYLGAGASALCFVTWNLAVKKLGAVKTSVYIYLVPVITIITSVLILHETITLSAGTGVLLTLTGLVLSEIKTGKKT